MTNHDVRIRLWQIHCPIWKLAAELGVSENTVGRWLRLPLSEDHSRRVEAALRNLEAQHAGR